MNWPRGRSSCPLRRIRGERRRKFAGVHHGQHRLPPVRAGGERSAHRENAARPRGARRLGGMGQRQQNNFLHRRRRHHQAPDTRLTATRPEPPAPTLWSTKKKTNDSTCMWPSPAARPYIFLFSGSHTTSEARYIPGGPAHGRIESAGAAQAGRGILSRPQRRFLLSSRERHRAEFPAGQSAGGRSAQRELAGSGAASAPT